MIADVRNWLRRYELVRRTRDELDLLRKYRAFRPELAAIAGTPHRLFANPREPRGRALLRTDCSGQPELKRLWLRAIQIMQPTAVIDVGANYGEFVFAATYAANCRVVALEADPSLGSYLERSRRLHPAMAQIDLVLAAAGAEHGGEVSFFVDKDWSGRSSVVRRPGQHRVNSITVPRVAVDTVIAERAIDASTLVFKIDVESYEPEVMAGMNQILERSHRALGLVEFDASTLVAVGKAPDEFLERLRRRFSVWALQRQHPPRRIERQADLAAPYRHADLLLTSDPSLAGALGLVPAA